MNSCIPSTDRHDALKQSCINIVGVQSESGFLLCWSIVSSQARGYLKKRLFEDATKHI